MLSNTFMFMWRLNQKKFQPCQKISFKQVETGGNQQDTLGLRVVKRSLLLLASPTWETMLGSKIWLGLLLWITLPQEVPLWFSMTRSNFKFSHIMTHQPQIPPMTIPTCTWWAWASHPKPWTGIKHLCSCKCSLCQDKDFYNNTTQK